MEPTNRRFHCFGCGAAGDVIDFVSRLEGISPKGAALLLALDFSVDILLERTSRSTGE